MSGGEVEIELRLLDERARFVEGSRAFVLHQPDVGRVEVGSPPADSMVWDHFDGDLMHTVVCKLDGGRTEGGGGTWDSTRLGCLASAPGSGDDPNQAGWIVIERIPPKWERVIITHGLQRLAQSPIRRTAVVPLAAANGLLVRVWGLDENETEIQLAEFDFSVCPAAED